MPPHSPTHPPNPYTRTQVFTQSFYTRVPARALATTRTAASITSKVLLALTTNDQVCV